MADILLIAGLSGAGRSQAADDLEDLGWFVVDNMPIALIEKRWWGLRGQAYFLSEYLDAPDGHDYFTKIKNKKLQAIAIKNIVDLFYRMHLLKLSHGDMKSSNIKVLDGNPYLIDLDSMRQHRCDYFALKAHVQDLRRFMQNWQAQ